MIGTVIVPEKGPRCMPSSRVSALTREEIAATARNFRSRRQTAKWTVLVEGRELPARPLVLEAAGVPPNDSTNSHQAIAILRDRGFDVRYAGKPLEAEDRFPAPAVVIEDLIRSLRGSLKGDYSLIEDREREHRIEKRR
jgi:hypothetical protein